MLKKLIKSNKGEIYLDVIIKFFVFVVLLIFVINVYAIMKSYTDLQYMASYVADVVAYNGRINTEVEQAKVSVMKKSNLPLAVFNIEVGEYFSVAEKKIQQGDSFTVMVSDTFYLISGFNNLKIPISLKAYKTALSERYWK